MGGLCACGATFRYISPQPNIFLTRLFSKTRLKRKDFQEIAPLAWAQEAPGSNPGAPTISSVIFFKNIEIVTVYMSLPSEEEIVVVPEYLKNLSSFQNPCNVMLFKLDYRKQLLIVAAMVMPPIPLPN